MNKKISALLALILCFTLVSCNNNKDTSSKVQDEEVNDVQSTSPFTNKALESAFATILEKEPSQLTAEDCESVRYIATGHETDDVLTLYVGFKDYADAYFAEVMKGEEADATALIPYIKTVPFEYDDSQSLDKDLALFTNLEVFEIYDVKISDVSFIKSCPDLIYGYFKDNGITDVSPLSDYQPQKLLELDFTQNNIENWEPLAHLSDKVIVNYSEQVFTSENGEKITIPNVIYLTDLLEKETHQETQPPSDDQTQTAPEANPNDEKEFSEETPTVSAEENTEQTETPEFSEIDWSVLFGE